ncbi:MAG TPA: hypothetical protein VGM74_10940 [Burkholderiaceae bacterium]|jgi:hypothetical protein
MAVRGLGRRTGLAFAGLILAAGPVLAAERVQRPAPGRHDAELCVTVGAAAPNCGPAQLDLRRDGSARVRVDDLTYTLKPHAGQAEVVLMHGSVEIDDFGVRYLWNGRLLQITDEERQMRYDVRVLN